MTVKVDPRTAAPAASASSRAQPTRADSDADSFSVQLEKAADQKPAESVEAQKPAPAKPGEVKVSRAGPAKKAARKSNLPDEAVEDQPSPPLTDAIDLEMPADLPLPEEAEVLPEAPAETIPDTPAETVAQLNILADASATPQPIVHVAAGVPVAPEPQDVVENDVEQPTEAPSRPTAATPREAMPYGRERINPPTAPVKAPANAPANATAKAPAKAPAPVPADESSIDAADISALEEAQADETSPAIVKQPLRPAAPPQPKTPPEMNEQPPKKVDKIAAAPAPSAPLETSVQVDPAKALHPPAPTEREPSFRPMPTPVVAAPATTPAAPLASADSARAAQDSPGAAPANTFDQIVLGLRTKMDGANQKAQIELNPPNLGKLQVAVEVSNGLLTAQFVASTDVVRDLLSSKMDQLRSVLEGQGIAVDKLAVSTSAAASDVTPANGSTNSQHEGRSGGAFAQDRQAPRHHTGDAFARMWRSAQEKQEPVDLLA